MRGPFRTAAFRRLFAGRVVTNVGDSLYFIAAMWLVYSLTDDPLYTGIAGFVTLGPSALQFLAGPLVDRWSIRRTLVGTQLIQAVVVAAIPLAHVLGLLRVEVVLVVMPVLAALNQLVYPAQTAALPRILDDEELVAANSAFSIAYQGLDMVANGLGGLLIGLLGAVALFAVDAVTFLLAAAVFLTVVVPPAGAETADEPAADGATAATDGGTADDDEPYLTRLREGAALIRGTFLGWLILGALVVNFTAGIVLAVIPVYADSLAVPGLLAGIGAAGAYGILMAAFAGGNFAGAIAANAVSDAPLGRTLIVGAALAGLLWTAAIAVGWLPLTAALIVAALVPIGAINVQIAAVVQSAPPDEYVGRVSSILGSGSTAMIPVGSLVGGLLAGAFGPQIAMASLGVGSVGLAGYVLLMPSLRRLPAPDEVALDGAGT